MRVLVVADSAFGNTWAVAEAMAQALGSEARVVRPSEVGPGDLDGLDLLVVGSPTQGGRPLPAVTNFIKGLPADRVKGLRFAAFDTRVAGMEQNFGLRLLVKVIGYAAPKIARQLTALGGKEVAPPEGFIVEGKEGPLRAGEMDRAQRWARPLQTVTVR